MFDAPKVKLGTLYEKTSKAGRRYFVGRFGAARILLFSTGETTEDGTPIWELLAEQAEERQANGSRPARTSSPAPAPRQDRQPGLPLDRAQATDGRGRRSAGPSEAADDGRAFHDDPLDDVLPR